MSDFIYGSKKRELEGIAEYLAETYFPKSVIDPEIIAKNNNISFCYGDYGNYFDGLIECENNKFHIFINESNSLIRTEERKRFTFGHELGHYFIDNHRNALKSIDSRYHSSNTGFVTSNIMELEADYFASCLLIPYQRLINECKNKNFDFQLLSHLASAFKISLTAMALKIVSKNIYPIFVMSVTNGKIDWYWPSISFPFTRLKYGKDQVSDYLITGKFHKNNIKNENVGVFKMEDFFHLVSQRERGRYFNERCIYIGESKTITFIWEYTL